MIKLHDYHDNQVRWIDPNSILDIQDVKYHVKGTWGKDCKDVNCSEVHTVHGGYWVYRFKESAKEILKLIEKE